MKIESGVFISIFFLTMICGSSFVTSVGADPVVDLNYDGIVDIVDVVIVAIAFGSVPGDPDWNPHADLNNDSIVDIADIVIVAVNFGKTFPHASSSFASHWGELKLTATAVCDTDVVLNLTLSEILQDPNMNLTVSIQSSLIQLGVLPEGLELVSGDLRWDGYCNVTRVSIQARARAVLDGEWALGGFARRFEPGASEGFGSGPITIVVSNGTVTSITK